MFFTSLISSLFGGGDADPPPPPEGMDYGQSIKDYLFAITDPEVQQRLLAAEDVWGKKYLSQNLGNVEGTIFGTGDQRGTLSMLEQMLPQISQMQSQALSAQREADISDIEALGGRATAALRASDPEMQKLLAQQGSVVDEMFGRTQGVTAQQGRMAEQSARAASQARGRQNDLKGMFAEALGREDYMRQNRQEYLGAAGQRFGMLGQTAADPFQAILGRPGMAFSGAQQQQGFGGNLSSSMMGPQTFDVNPAINLALQDRANLMNYNAAIFGGQSAQAAGRMQMFGNIMGGMLAAYGGGGGGY